MARSAWKGKFFDIATWRWLQFCRFGGLYTSWSRRDSVSEGLVGRDLRIHWGKEFEEITIQPEQLGYKLGSLSMTKVIGSSIHRFNRLAQKKKKTDELSRQRKVRKQKANTTGRGVRRVAISKKGGSAR